MTWFILLEIHQPKTALRPFSCFVYNILKRWGKGKKWKNAQQQKLKPRALVFVDGKVIMKL
jgi:hypothetical protein